MKCEQKGCTTEADASFVWPGQRLRPTMMSSRSFGSLGREAESTARQWTAPSYMAEPYVHVVRLVPEVVKTVRRKA